MKNPPLTFIVNIMNISTMLCNCSRIMVPVNLAILCPASILSRAYKQDVSDKYLDGNSSWLSTIDIVTHWIPTAVLTIYNRKRRLRKRDIRFAAILPWLYFSMGQKRKNSFFFVNPVHHLQHVYPGVPLRVFGVYYLTLGCLWNSATRKRSFAFC